MSRIVSNKNQINRLVELMEKNLDIARNVCSKVTAQKSWQRVAEELNILGPPPREADKWQRVWNDLKFKIRKKVSEQKAESHATGGGPKKIPKFTDIEDAIIKIIKLDIPANSCSMNFGLTDVENEYDYFLDNLRESPEPNKNIIDSVEPNKTAIEVTASNKTPTKDRPLNKPSVKITDERVVLLEKQMHGQNEFFESVKKDIKKIKNSIEEIKSYSRKTYYLQEKQLKIKEEKLKLKENFAKEDEDRKAKLNLKIKILELEQKNQRDRLY